jgi:hypothetical protein
MMPIVIKNFFSSITDLGTLVILLIAAHWNLVDKQTFGMVIMAYVFGRGIIGGQKQQLQAIATPPPGSSTGNSATVPNNPTTSIVLLFAAGAAEVIRRKLGA